jgi:hypothetical protein
VHLYWAIIIIILGDLYSATILRQYFAYCWDFELVIIECQVRLVWLQATIIVVFKVLFQVAIIGQQLLSIARLVEMEEHPVCLVITIRLA